MDRRIETRVIDTDGAVTATLIQKDACEVWWIIMSPQQAGIAGLLQIYDGFDTGGKLQFQVEPSYCRPCHFVPPIPCDQGIYVTTDLGIACYTIGYRPKGWPREQK